MQVEKPGSKTRTLQDANLIETAPPISITYSRTSITGQALLSYQDAERELSFSGDEIDRQMTSMGELVTVTIESVVDAFDVRFTLVVPLVRVEGGDRVEFETLGVETRDRSGAFVLPPGPHGVLQTSRVHQLGALASFVVA